MPRTLKTSKKTSIFALRKMGVFSIYALDYLVMKRSEENLRTEGIRRYVKIIGIMFTFQCNPVS